MTTLFEFNYSTVSTQLGSHVLQVYNMLKIVKFFRCRLKAKGEVFIYL